MPYESGADAMAWIRQHLRRRNAPRRLREDRIDSQSRSYRMTVAALAGATGSLAMSPVMSRRATRHLPPAFRLREFPPRRVVSAVARSLGVDQVSPAVLDALTWPAHLAYGAAAGALYGATRRGRGVNDDWISAGALMGLSVWASGYAGWLPVLGIRETTVRGAPSKIPVPLLAHLVFGVTTAALYAYGAESATPRGHE